MDTDRNIGVCAKSFTAPHEITQRCANKNLPTHEAGQADDTNDAPASRTLERREGGSGDGVELGGGQVAEAGLAGGAAVAPARRSARTRDQLEALGEIAFEEAVFVPDPEPGPWARKIGRPVLGVLALAAPEGGRLHGEVSRVPMQ